MRSAPVVSLAVLTIAPTVFANPTHDTLRALPRAGQTVVLAKLAQDSGYRCTGRDAIYKGTDTRTDVAFWRLDCVEGRRSYLIGIEPDSQGSTKFVDCAVSRMLEQRAGSKKDLCFDPW